MLIRHMREAVDLVRQTDEPNVGLIYDTAHVAMMDGELLMPFKEACRYISLIQLADMPGRVEPGAGTLDLVTFAVEAIRSGYSGLVDLEHGWRTRSKEGETAGFESIKQFDQRVRAAVALEPSASTPEA
jgi:hydroxypyruvate isomerase